MHKFLGVLNLSFGPCTSVSTTPQTLIYYYGYSTFNRCCGDTYTLSNISSTLLCTPRYNLTSLIFMYFMIRLWMSDPSLRVLAFQTKDVILEVLLSCKLAAQSIRMMPPLWNNTFCELKEQGNQLWVYVHKLNLVGHSAVNATFQIEGLDHVMNFLCLVVFIESDFFFAEFSPKFDMYKGFFMK